MSVKEKMKVTRGLKAALGLLTFTVFSPGLASNATAAPTAYTITGATTTLNGDQYGLSGSFIFDTSTDTQSAVDLFLSGSGPFSGEFKEQPALSMGISDNIFGVDNNIGILAVFFVSALDVPQDNIIATELCPNSIGTCTGQNPPFADRAPSGAAVVPEPASLALFGGSLAGLVFLRRRKAA